jgi:hypothetical protein
MFSRPNIIIDITGAFKGTPMPFKSDPIGQV